MLLGRRLCITSARFRQKSSSWGFIDQRSKKGRTFQAAVPVEVAPEQGPQHHGRFSWENREGVNSRPRGGIRVGSQRPAGHGDSQRTGALGQVQTGSDPAVGPFIV